jgi:DHA2 family multidrug resistance protein-like MFS transporter
MSMEGENLAGLSDAQALAVSTTLTGAVEVAKTMGYAGAPVWLDTARGGFSLGFAVCCALATVTLLLLAAIARKVYATAHINESHVAAH